jgi:mannobiose 2-epimerase
LRRRLTQIAELVLALVSVHVHIVQSADAPWAGKGAYIPKLEKNLREKIAAFWFSKSLDRTNGGYTINFGPKGEPKGPGTKMIVTQARTVWLFSRLVRSVYGGPEHLQAAEHGYRFLKEKMWDAKNGGFYWEVDASGNQKLKPRKHLYGQAFGLYALSEYYLASKKNEVLNLATRLFNVLESKSHDKTYAGYLEFFNEDWTPRPPARPLTWGEELRRLSS